MTRRRVLIGVAAALIAAWATSPRGQGGAPRGEWPSYGGDLGHTRYAPLDQITAANFNDLEVAWRFKTDNLGPRPEFNLQSTPLMVRGRLYSTGGTRRAAVALDAATGELLWVHSEDEGARAAASPRQLSGRGLAYWSDGREERILYVTTGYRLVALDARTGNPIPGFGRNGVVDLKADLDPGLDLPTAPIGLHATPTIAGNVVIVGAAFETGANPKSRRNVKGAVRGFDVRTGQRLWTFKTIPEPGEVGHESWENDSWAYTGNTGVWAQISADEELGLAYLPVELPTHDYYGGARPGNGLFGESLVAIDYRTGERKWHFQLVHHGIWDMDIPCAPILADIRVNGRTIKAIAQPTKQGFLYVFDRVTGEPVWPIEERPVPQGDTPGEQYSPTQPFPTRPAAYDRQGLSVDDLIDFTPELRRQAIEIANQFVFGPVFTPPSIAGTNPGDKLGTIQLPGSIGGADWTGAAFDPDTSMLYVPSMTNPFVANLLPGDPAQTNLRYRAGDRRLLQGPQGLPLLKPPYGRITAIDLNKGEIAWQVANGDGPRNHPLLKDLNLPPLGQAVRASPLLTKTLLFVTEGDQVNVRTPPNGGGKKFRAYDKATGQVLWETEFKAGSTGTPITYMHNGKQFIVFAIGGQGVPPEFVALALP